MTTTPDGQSPDEQGENEKTGVEVGMTEGEGSTFEPEEDPQGDSDA